MDRYSTPVSSQTVKLHVGSVPWTCTEQEIKDYFQHFGPVIKVKMAKRSRDARRINKGYCTLTVQDQETARKILSTTHTNWSRTITCSEYRGRSAVAYTNQHNNDSRLIVKNIPFHITIDEVRPLFDVYGDILLCYFFIPKKGSPEPAIPDSRSQIASIQFKSAVIAQHVKQQAFEIGGSKITVEQYDPIYKKNRVIAQPPEGNSDISAVRDSEKSVKVGKRGNEQGSPYNELLEEHKPHSILNNGNTSVDGHKDEVSMDKRPTHKWNVHIMLIDHTQDNIRFNVRKRA